MTAAGLSPSKGLRISLWVAQSLVFVAYCVTGAMDLSTPISTLSQTIPWTGQTPEAFVRFIGFVELAGGLGILLPAATRILPRLTVLAALGSSVLQIFAMAFHLSRGEVAKLWVNIVLLSLSLFVLLGRHNKAPIGKQ